MDSIGIHDGPQLPDELSDIRLLGSEYSLRNLHPLFSWPTVVATYDGGQPAFCAHDFFNTRDEIRLYNDTTRTEDLMWIQARSAASRWYDVTWAPSGEWVGSIRRWELLDPLEYVVGVIKPAHILYPVTHNIATVSDFIVAEFAADGLARYRLSFQTPGAAGPVDRRLIFAAVLCYIFRRHHF